MVSACLPTPSLRNPLTCHAAMISAGDVGKGKSCSVQPEAERKFLIVQTSLTNACSLLVFFVCFRFLNLKIQEGEAHNIFCPAFDCYQLVPVEVIESVVSREMDKRYLQFDIKVNKKQQIALF